MVNTHRENSIYRKNKNNNNKFVFNDSLYINVCFQSMVCCMQHNLLYAFVGLVIALALACCC